MGRDTLIYLFIGRKCTDEEELKILKYIRSDPDYYDRAHILQLDLENPFMEIDGYSVVLICNQNKDSWYICEKFISVYDIEDRNEPLELDLVDLTTIKYSNNKLMLVTEISF